MWLACYSNQEIADEIGYSRRAVNEFENLLQNSINGTGSENAKLSENEALTNLQVTDLLCRQLELKHKEVEVMPQPVAASPNRPILAITPIKARYVVTG